MDIAVTTFLLVFLVWTIPAAVAWTIGFLLTRSSRVLRLTAAMAVALGFALLAWPLVILFLGIPIVVAVLTLAAFEWALAKDRR